MCRFIFYLGAPIRLSTIISEPSHSLLVQSLHSSCQSVSLNADGFGIAWYVPDITPIPGVFKDITPAWSNINLRQLARVTKSGCIAAHIRAASAGAIVNTNCHPFTFRNFSWMHNGCIPFYNHLKRDIYSMISDSAFELIKGTTDSELLFALFISNYEKEIGYKAEKAKTNGTVYYSTHCALEPEEKPYPSHVNNTEIIPKVLQETIFQIHELLLQYELKNGLLSNNTGSEGNVNGNNGSNGAGASNSCGGSGSSGNNSPTDLLMEGASLRQTNSCCKLNLAVTDGFTVVATRYVTGMPEAAHSLYWSRGSTIKFDDGHCQLGRSTDSSPHSKSYSESLVISSEPLASDFQCEPVPVNHIVIGNSSGYFSIESIN